MDVINKTKDIRKKANTNTNPVLVSKYAKPKTVITPSKQKA
jgi:hypothetical protein